MMRDLPSMGPEDKDIYQRLTRYCGIPGEYPRNLITSIPTSDTEKLVNLDTNTYKTKRDMHNAMRYIYGENNEKGLIVANVGKEWGKW